MSDDVRQVTAVEVMKTFMEEEEGIPFKDSGKVVTIRGGDAKVRAQAIRECIKRIETENE